MTAPRWLDRLVGDTRQRILQLLLRSDRTVQEIADELDVTANAVRGHLSSLELDGLVVRGGTRRGEKGGKPATTYVLSREADELFPKAYAFVLGALLAELDEELGSDRVREVVSRIGERVASPASGSQQERVEAAAEALRALGGTVEVFEQDGAWRIQGFSCPLSAVIEQDARVCGLAETLVQRTTGGTVRERCSRECRARCGFEISFSGDR